MRLDDYLDKTGISTTQFAERIGVSQPAVTRYCLGLRTPRPEIIKKIVKVTKGKVSAAELLGIS